MNDLLKFYNEQFVPFWKRRVETKKLATESAEKLFWDALKLVISLSTGVMAFVSVMSKRTEISSIVKFIILLATAIISAMLAFAWSSWQYKKDADRETELLKELNKLYSQSKIEEIQEIISTDSQNLWKKEVADWHTLSIVLGLISLSSFLIGTIWFILTISLK